MTASRKINPCALFYVTTTRRKLFSSSSKIDSSKEKQIPKKFRRSSRRVVYFLNSNNYQNPIVLPTSSMPVITQSTYFLKKNSAPEKRRKYKRKCYRKRFSMKPPAPHNTTSMLMDAHSEIDSEESDDTQTETDFNFYGSFLPSLTKEDYEEFFCNSSIDI